MVGWVLGHRRVFFLAVAGWVLGSHRVGSGPSQGSFLAVAGWSLGLQLVTRFESAVETVDISVS